MTSIGDALAVERYVDAGFDHVYVRYVDPIRRGSSTSRPEELLGEIAPGARV